MKYIRTEEGIYELESKEISSWEYIDNDTAINEYGVEGAFYTIYYFDENKGHYSECDGKGGHSCIFIEEKDILKQADTINEVCDYIRFKTKNGATHYLDLKKISIENIVYIFGGKNIELDSIRYCIETEKGLIFVAKMDNEGKLVLI